MMRTHLLALLLGLATALGAAQASAAEGQRPCRDDMMKHCSDAVGDRQGMRACMRENFEKFSAACQARIQEAQAQGRGAGGPRGQGAGTPPESSN
jgi:hypothetical protein